MVLNAEQLALLEFRFLKLGSSRIATAASCGSQKCLQMVKTRRLDGVW
jgi:hypothetical protein